MLKRKAVILGCEGLRLTKEEKAFFHQVQPFGFILFARNIKDPQQVRLLVRDLRQCVGDDACPVLIDQEGGRVQRLHPPNWRVAPPAKVFATLWEQDMEKARRATYLNALLIGEELRLLGLNVDCAPVVDIPMEHSHEIIGDRAFGNNVASVADLAREQAKGLVHQGVLPVLKHIPGHGRATVDSHLGLPRVKASLPTLRKTDFSAFRQLVDLPFAMTAHIIYEAIDPQEPCTWSKKVIKDIIRREIGFKGILMTDDLSMKALTGDFATRARKSFEAGCDLALHCNGNMEEMQAICNGSPFLSPQTADYWLVQALPQIKQMGAFSKQDALSELKALVECG